MMMYCVHLQSTEADFQSQRGAQTLAAGNDPSLSFEIQTIGRGGMWRNVPFAVGGLRKARINLVHAWDMPSLAAAAFANVRKIVFTPSRFPTRRAAGWLKTIMAYRDVALICDSHTACRAWVRNGVPAACCRVIRTGVDFDRIRPRRDPTLREALGLRQADHVILAVGESSRGARHDHSVWATSILHVLEPNDKLLLWGRGPSCGLAARLANSVGHPELVIIAERKLGRAVEFEELLPAADMALITADRPVAPLPIAICMGSRLPIVATPSSVVSEMLEDRRSALFAPAGAPRRIAQAIEDLRASTELQNALADCAAKDASERYAIADFIAQHHALYRQFVAGSGALIPVSKPALASGLSERA